MVEDRCAYGLLRVALVRVAFFKEQRGVGLEKSILVISDTLDPSSGWMWFYI
jgi:hypothetical protein